MEEPAAPTHSKFSGAASYNLSILIGRMRREGFELMVGSRRLSPSASMAS